MGPLGPLHRPKTVPTLGHDNPDRRRGLKSGIWTVRLPPLLRARGAVSLFRGFRVEGSGAEKRLESSWVVVSK